MSNGTSLCKIENCGDFFVSFHQQVMADEKKERKKERKKKERKNKMEIFVVEFLDCTNGSVNFKGT